MDMLAQGAAWLQSQLKASASETVRYTSGAVSVNVQATFGRSTLQLSDDFNGQVVRTDADFIIAAADLVAAFNVAGGSFSQPQRGDTVDATIAGTKQLFQALEYGKEPVWTWEDPFNLMMRVRTKYVGTG